MFGLWAVLVILTTVHGWEVKKVKASTCYRTSDGREGTCMELKWCNVSLQAYQQCRLKPETCGAGIQNKVCCPKYPWVVRERPIDYSCNMNNYARRVIGQLVNNRTLYPHVAALGYSDPGSTDYAWLCGGTLIHLRFVLTAAHCLKRPGPKVVLLGVNDLWDKDDRHAQLIEVHSFLQHEGYKSGRKGKVNKYNDIGLVYLRRAIVDTQYVSPACLLTTEMQDYGEVTTVGWGKGLDDGGEVPAQKMLREARMSMVECKKHHVHKNYKEFMFCAWDKSHAACEGDSGGPLQVYHDKRLYVKGVYVIGPITCEAQTYSRFINLLPFLDWIEEKVWTPERCVFKKKLPQ